jgi:hypothetical protein
LTVILVSDSDLFQTANGFLPGGSNTTTIQHTNAQLTYTIHILHTHKTTPLKRNKQNKGKQISSQSYTNSAGHIIANEYGVKVKSKPIPVTGHGGL